MAKKFGKFLLFTAAAGTVAAVAYHYLTKKEVVPAAEEDDDYDNFSDDLEEETLPATMCLWPEKPLKKPWRRRAQWPAL